MVEKFESLNLKKELLRNLEELNFNAMTPIQTKSLPFILSGRDLVGQAKTGSGKTAAFGLGILNALDIGDTRIQSLILCPTRELAEQVAKELRMLARMMKNVKVLTITGGRSEYYQEKSLDHGAHIIVGTPGRVLRLIKNKVLILDTASSFILDEADRMLDMGFIDDILEIAQAVPVERQTLLFSATFPQEIKELGLELQHNAEIVKVDTGHSKEIIEQTFYELESHKNKSDALFKILSFYRPNRFIVFCKTKLIADSVAKFLTGRNIYAKAIHGDLMQNERDAVMTMFSNESLSGLVATDVAARGLDIKDLELVINYDLPMESQTFVHRVGRTGRAGKSGIAISFFVSQEREKFQTICELLEENYQQQKIEELDSCEDYDLVPPMKTIYIRGGKKDKLRPGDIAGAIVGEAGLDFQDIGKISIMAITSFVAIKREFVKTVISKLNDGKIKKRKFKVGHL